MNLIEEQYSLESQLIIDVSRDLYWKNMLAGADGNISIRVNNEVLITSSGVQKKGLDFNKFSVVHMDGSILFGKPSSELLMHLEVYQSCTKARAVIHAHPPTCIAWTIAEPHLKFLDADCMSEVILALGKIPISGFALPGTSDMAENLKPLLPKYRAIILARHGALSWGESMEEAVNGMERMEHVAQILASAKALGGITSLPSDQLTKLNKMRALIGDRTL